MQARHEQASAVTTDTVSARRTETVADSNWRLIGAGRSGDVFPIGIRPRVGRLRRAAHGVDHRAGRRPLFPQQTEGGRWRGPETTEFVGRSVLGNWPITCA